MSLDPRDPNSPFNMRNRHSPFYDPQKAHNQTGELAVGLCPLGGAVLIIGVALLWLYGKLEGVLTAISPEHPGHALNLIVLLLVALIMVLLGVNKRD